VNKYNKEPTLKAVVHFKTGGVSVPVAGQTAAARFESTMSLYLDADFERTRTGYIEWDVPGLGGGVCEEIGLIFDGDNCLLGYDTLDGPLPQRMVDLLTGAGFSVPSEFHAFEEERV
jgi:hypothetical protein